MADDITIVEEEQRYRASVYALLAALFRVPPTQALLNQLVALAPAEAAAGDELATAMAALAGAAADADPAELEDEFQNLFIGIGRGEVVPYGSWHRTGFLMEQPLSDLRDDLRRLGFERAEANREPEDHITALFEVFSVIISNGLGLEEERRFYSAHLEPWLNKFFADLEHASSARFYRFVARFGAAMTTLETIYLSLDI